MSWGPGGNVLFSGVRCHVCDAWESLGKRFLIDCNAATRGLRICWKCAKWPLCMTCALPVCEGAAIHGGCVR